MREGFLRPSVRMVDVAREVVGQRLGPAPRFVMPTASVERVLGMKLPIEQTDAPFDAAAVAPQALGYGLGMLVLPVRARGGGDPDVLAFQGRALFALGPVGVVAEQVAFERGLEQGIESLNVVPVAGDLLYVRDVAFRREDQGARVRRGTSA